MWFLIAVEVSVITINVRSAKILAVLPTSSRSHHIVGSALMKALVNNGHEVGSTVRAKNDGKIISFVPFR